MESADKHIVWLKVTDYFQGWLRKNLGNKKAKAHGEPVLHFLHLPGAKDAMRLDAEVFDAGDHETGNSISALWYNALSSGLDYDPNTVEKEYGITREKLCQYMPLAVPDIAFIDGGRMRPWTENISFGSKQSIEVMKVLRNAFWKAVLEYSEMYAREHHGEKYAQADMLEAFCHDNDTDDIYLDAMRREWQRRCKREKR